MALVFVLPAAAQDAKKPVNGGHDFIFLAEARPLLIRVHVRVDGKTLQEAHDEFIAHLFRHLDVKEKGYLGTSEMERAPLARHIMTGSPASGLYGTNISGMGGGGMQALTQYAKKNRKDGKISQSDLAKFYAGQGLAPFGLQAEAKSSEGGMMMMLGGGAPTEPSVDEIGGKIFSLLDTAKTGRLTRKELSAAHDILIKLDADEDEMITVPEIVPPAPSKPGAGMFSGMMGPGTAPKLEKLDQSRRVFLVAMPGEFPMGLFTSMLERYGPRGKKVEAAENRRFSRQALGLDEATFKALDKNGDGMLDETELAGLIKRPPDLEFIVHMGDSRGVVSADQKGQPTLLAKQVKTLAGLAMLEMPGTRIEFRGDGPIEADPYAPFTRLQWTVLFKQFDKNKDGYLDEQEAKVSVFADAFKAMDRDGDGKVSEQEFNDYIDFLADTRSRSKKACVSLVLSDESRGLFDLLDVDRDGRLSVRELRAAPGLLAKYDRQGQGFLTPADLPRSYRFTVRFGPPQSGAEDINTIFLRLYGGGSTKDAIRAPSKGPLWFRKMDKNRDGDVSRREWLGSPELFDQIDTDGDGLISAEEAERYDAKSRRP